MRHKKSILFLLFLLPYLCFSFGGGEKPKPKPEPVINTYEHMVLSEFKSYYDNPKNWESNIVGRGTLFLTRKFILKNNFILPNNIEIKLTGKGEIKTNSIFSLTAIPTTVNGALTDYGTTTKPIYLIKDASGKLYYPQNQTSLPPLGKILKWTGVLRTPVTGLGTIPKHVGIFSTDLQWE